MPELSGIFGPRVGALRGRRVLVSGGASGIGRATVALFIEQGARVAILDQDGPALEAACSKFGCIGREGSVADASLMVRLIDSIGEQLGGMDGLVHAAGIAPSDGFRATNLATWRNVMDVNLDGTFHVLRAAVPWLERETGASLVTVASGLALRPGLSGFAYSASKAAIVNMTRSLAIELAPSIRANCVCPGVVNTPLAAKVLEKMADPGERAARMAHYALGRVAQPQEVAQAILYLLSDAASFVTGVALAVDGGRTYH